LDRNLVALESNALLKLLHNAYSSFDGGHFNEKIGVLIGKNNVLSDVLEATRQSTPVFCSLDHDKVFEAYKNLREGEMLIGWYHTHDGFTTPSQIDEHSQSNWQAFQSALSIVVDVKHAKIMVWKLGPEGVEEIPFTVMPTIQRLKPVVALGPTQNLGQLFRKQSRHVKWKRMQWKTVIVFGVGQLGTLTATSLCKSGIGELRLIDRDKVELRNVNSQILYTLEDIGRPKVEALAERLNSLAPWTRIAYRNMEVPTGEEESSIYEERIRKLKEFMIGCELALSCFDNVRSRITASILCRELGIPLIDAGCYGLNGQVLTTIWGKTPCIGCLDIQGKGDISCDIAPTTVATGFAVSCIQTKVAIDLLHRRRVPTFIAIDLENYTTKRVEIMRREGCWICGQN
jgi:adenylyltransferase/sulfurtransferase